MLIRFGMLIGIVVCLSAAAEEQQPADLTTWTPQPAEWKPSDALQMSRCRKGC